jgi:hypothetical protein
MGALLRVQVSAGGLRLPAAACRSATGRETIAASSVKLNEASSEAVIPGAATERIPAITEESLYALAKGADELAEQLAALQAWIRESGLY